MIPLPDSLPGPAGPHGAGCDASCPARPWTLTRRLMASPREQPKAYRDIPPLRKSPFKEDEYDQQRVEYVTRMWHQQDGPLRLRDRQIEENVRMLCGQQWTVWSDYLMRFVDVAQLMTESDLRWRQRPVINKLLGWYVLTHARLTENPPIITFLPRSGDAHDAELAEVMDTVFKSKWAETNMLEVIDRLIAWLIPGGRAHLKSRIDPTLGDLVVWRGPGMVPVLGPDGQPVPSLSGEPMELYVEDAAYDKKGQLLTRGFVDEHGIGYDEPPGKRPHAERKGNLAVEVLSALEVRSAWGEHVPWHRRRWHMHRTFMTPAEVWETWGLDVEADQKVGAEATGPGELQRLMMGAGFFGAASQSSLSEFGGAEVNEAYVSVYELWERPSAFPGMEETEDSPGGRLTVIAGGKVARDGVRIARFPHTSPIRCFDFVNVPGRPGGTSPQESMNPVQRAFNRTSAQILQHTALVTDPKPLIHISSGIGEGNWTNEPGTGFVVNTEPGVEPVKWVAPPPMGEEAYRTQGFLGATLEQMGHQEGAQGAAPTRDSSGELVRELRYNSDRPIASTARRAVQELARMAEDWVALLPLAMDEEEVIAYAGDDQVVRTVNVYPDLFKQGNVNASPDIESMLPEGRGERMDRVERMWLAGAFGDPLSPEARSTYLERARFPHMGRDARPGGVHRVTAERENGALARGAPAEAIPVFPWYDDAVHLAVLEEWMSSPEWQTTDPAVQQQCVLHREMHLSQIAAKQQQMMAEQAAQLAAADETAAQAADQTRPLPAEAPPETPGQPKPVTAPSAPAASAA